MCQHDNFCEIFLDKFKLHIPFIALAKPWFRPWRLPRASIPSLHDFLGTVESVNNSIRTQCSNLWCETSRPFLLVTWLRKAKKKRTKKKAKQSGKLVKFFQNQIFHYFWIIFMSSKIKMFHAPMWRMTNECINPYCKSGRNKIAKDQEQEFFLFKKQEIDGLGCVLLERWYCFLPIKCVCLLSEEGDLFPKK